MTKRLYLCVLHAILLAAGFGMASAADHLVRSLLPKAAAILSDLRSA